MGASGSAPSVDQTPSALQMRMRILEISPVFSDLNDGLLRAVARRMRAVALAARDTLRLGGAGGDIVVFLASGQVEESVTDATGKVLLTRRPAPGDLVILPAPRTAARDVTNIYGLTDAVLLTLDRDGMLEGLGSEVEKVALMLDKLWEQELSAAAAAEAQTASRTAAPIVAVFSAKGGAGTTTLAINTAAALARENPPQGLVLHLAGALGPPGPFSDPIPAGAVAGATKASEADFEPVLRGNIVNHKTGMGVLPGTLRPEEGDTLTGERVGRVLDVVVAGHKVIG